MFVTWKNQSCSKLPEMARKLVEHDFWNFYPPPQKNWRTTNFCQKLKKSKLFKIAWNGEKTSQKWFLDFLAPPKKKLGGVQHLMSEMKKIKVVQNCLKWRENVLKMVFVLFSPPSNWGAYKIFCQKWKNQSCCKLCEMARKFVGSDFWPLPQKIGGRTNFFYQKWKKWKAVANCKKIRRKWFLEFCPPSK